MFFWFLKWEEAGKVVKTCGVGHKADFWFITEHVNFNTLAEIIYVGIEAGHKLCEDPGKKDIHVRCYSDDFEVYIYPGKYMYRTNIENITSYFKPFYNITSNTSPIEMLTRAFYTFSFNTQNYSKGVTLAVRSRGACGEIFRMNMYYYYCEETSNEGVKFERTSSPAEGFKNVTGNCSENSIPSNHITSVKRSCYPNGTWSKLENDTLECFCVEGYTTNKTDGSCSGKLHLQIVMNSCALKKPLTCTILYLDYALFLILCFVFFPAFLTF